MTRPMPTINLTIIRDKLQSMSYTFVNPHDSSITTINGWDTSQGIVARQGKNNGCLRASKPTMVETIITRVRYDHTGRYRDNSLVDCATAQIWRYVAFEASPLGQHHSLPVMAGYDCPFDMPTEQMNVFSKWCQSVADAILETIPRKPGLERWGRAFYG